MLDAFVDGAFAAVDPSSRLLYFEGVRAALPTVARRYLEELMATRTAPALSEFSRSLIDQGKAEGKAEAVLAVLAARGIEVDAAARARVLACADPGELDTWVRRSVAVATVAELFDAPSA